MLQTAMKPRFVRLFSLMLVLVAAFIWLGKWQWGTANNEANQKVLEEASQRTREPLDAVIKPQTPFDNSTSLQPITVTGRYDASKTELVAGRVLEGKHGWWVMTPLVVDSTGARLPIVRGFVDKTTNIPKPPSGTVTVEGALAPGESVSTMDALPPGQIGTIDMGLLLNKWDGRVYNAFIFSTDQQPATRVKAGETTPEHIPPPVPRTTHIEWRNAAYAIQWWVFAVFAVFMWVKLVRDEHHLEIAADESRVDENNEQHHTTPSEDDSPSDVTTPPTGEREDDR